MSDTTPFLGLLRPFVTKKVGDVVDGIRAAFDTLDTWAEANQGGGGGAVPDSWFLGYMVGFNDGVGAPAPFEFFDWSNSNAGAPHIVGSDLRLNPLDGTEVEVLTAGDYVISVDISFRADEDPTAGTVQMALDGTVVEAGLPLVANDFQSVHVGTGDKVHVPWTTPPMRLRVNDTIKVRLMNPPSVGAVTALEGAITVKRTS